MRVICTSNVPLAYDQTVHDTATHHALTFAADNAGYDPTTGPAPSASVSMTMEADEAADYGVGSAWDLELTPAAVEGTVDYAKSQAEAVQGDVSPSPEPDQSADDAADTDVEADQPATPAKGSKATK